MNKVVFFFLENVKPWGLAAEMDYFEKKCVMTKNS